MTDASKPACRCEDRDHLGLPGICEYCSSAPSAQPAAPSERKWLNFGESELESVTRERDEQRQRADAASAEVERLNLVILNQWMPILKERDTWQRMAEELTKQKETK